MRIVAIEAVDPVLRVDRDRSGLDLKPLGRLLPLLVHPIGVFAAADDRFHVSTPLGLSSRRRPGSIHPLMRWLKMGPGFRRDDKLFTYAASSLKYLTALPAHILCFSSAGTFS